MSEPVAPLWSRCLAAPAEAFPATALAVRSGSLPPGLAGTLYRNGPGRLGRGGRPVGHWFDGDGAVLAVRFAGGEATATYRYVETAGLRAEVAAGRLLFGNYGMTAPGPFWNHWRRPLKNTANTAVLALPDRLLALWEGGGPHALDLDSLATFGPDLLDGALTPATPFSAHPKRCGACGELFNFGVEIGRHAQLRLYRMAADGHVIAQAAHRLDGVPFIHDFVLAGRYLLFLIPPVRIPTLPVLLGTKSYSDAMRWRPELGTQILVFDRASLALVARGTTEPWFQWHVGNGAAADGGWVVLDLVRYPDFATNAHLRELASGRTETPVRGTLWRLAIDPRRADVHELAEMSDRSVEFPVVAARDSGRPWQRTFVAMHRRGADPASERYDALGRFDHPTGTWDEADLGGGRYPSEPIIAPDAAGGPDWLLTVVYDGHADASEVQVYAADRLNDGPVCVLGLPRVIPLGFHGCWRPAPA